MGGIVVNEIAVQPHEETSKVEEHHDLSRQAEQLFPLLREYAEKLLAFNTELMNFLESVSSFLWSSSNYSRAAWLLDRFELIRLPLEKNLSRASALHEHGDLPIQICNEMDLRMRELEAQLHHAIRQVNELHSVLGSSEGKIVAPLQYKSGLPGTRNRSTNG
jgi:hypothetical protein